MIELDKPFRLGQCKVFPNENTIQIDGQDKKNLQPKYIEVLTYLAQAYPRVVPRDEIIENIWGSDNYAGEKALTNTVWRLRQNLQSIDTETEVIQTIRKRGYRLQVEPVYDLESEPDAAAVQVVELENTLHTESKSTNNIAYAFIGMFAVLILVFLLYPFKKELDIPNQVTDLTREPGAEVFPSPSPDGRYVVYKWWTQDKPGNLFMKDTERPDDEPRQLTYDDDYETMSTWSLDGEYLYYAHVARDKSHCKVEKLHVKRNQIETVADCSNTSSYQYIDVSPDGKFLAYHGKREMDADGGIYFLPLTEDNAKPYRFSCANQCGYVEYDFAFSPNGKHIAVTRRVNRFNENIYLVDIQTKEAEQLTFGEADIVGLTWHPDGKTLVYGTQRTNIRQGYAMDIKSKQLTPISARGFSYPKYTKQSGELFYQDRSEHYHIAQLNIRHDAFSAPFPVVQSEYHHHQPHYSEQAKQLVYVSNETGFDELWASDAVGRNRVQLTNLKTQVAHPRWSHDGTRVAFLAPANEDKTDQVYIIDVASKKLTRLPSPHSEHNRPTWSWDDKAIIAAIYDFEYTDLHRISLVDGTSKRITFDGATYGQMTSENTLLYVKRGKGLWQKELNSDEAPINVIERKDFNTSYAWVYENGGVFHRFFNEDNEQISFFDFDKKQNEALAFLPRRNFQFYGTLSYSTELNKIYYTATQFPQSDIKRLDPSNAD